MATSNLTPTFILLIFFILNITVPSVQSLQVSFRFGATVAKDGSGDHTKIADAIAAAPSHLSDDNRFYIRIKPGVYKEHVVVGDDKPYLAIIGDDPTTTKITNNRHDPNFHLIETGTLSNCLWDGVYGMEHNPREHRRSKCWSSRCSPQFQNCVVTVAPKLKRYRKKVRVYLGRPWRDHATVVFMESYLDDVVQRDGWKDREHRIELVNLAEYHNWGPGANTDGRVKWPGVHIITDAKQAMNYTVAKYIDGLAWLPRTGIPFRAGLGN